MKKAATRLINPNRKTVELNMVADGSASEVLGGTAVAADARSLRSFTLVE